MGPLVTKTLCGVLIVSLSVLFGYLPVLISRKFPFLSASDPRHNKKALRNTVFSFVLNFGGGVLERFLPTNQHTQRKLLNFEF